ncbi:MAG: hypothetical protein WCT77_01665, partial [Bacteroidota bacterium]
FILLIAYWLHLPTFSFSRLIGGSQEMLMKFYECDVLNAIVLSSIIALIFLMLIPKMKILPYIYASLALFVFFMAPFIWQSNPFEGLPQIISAYFSHPPMSKFPLFHWSGYFFAGVAVTAWFMQFENKKKLATILAISGWGLMFLLYYTRAYTEAYPAVVNWWLASPAHSFFRLSGAIGVFSLLFLLEKFYKNNRVGDVLRLSGQESLFMYTFHLMIVYGSIVNLGLNYFLGPRLGPPETIFTFIAATVMTYWGAVVWNSFKTKSPVQARWLMVSFTILFIIGFIINPL